MAGYGFKLRDQITTIQKINNRNNLRFYHSRHGQINEIRLFYILPKEFLSEESRIYIL
jgi:hypothetical protein